MSTPLNIQTGKKIKELRNKKDLTQFELSELSGVGYKYLQMIEGKNPPNISLKVIEKLSKALKVKPATLFDFE